MTADLSRLSDGERQVLALLAAGHTAKSAADATGLSVNAVNERLREARRKTGVGSSRELARLLEGGPQENRDKQIGVPDPDQADDTLSHDPPAAGRYRMGAFVMVVLLAAALAGIALYQSPSEPPVAADPRIPALVRTAAPNVAELHATLAAEPRDAAWANGAEADLRTLYERVGDLRALVVTCRSTLCEVIADLPPHPAASTALTRVQTDQSRNAAAGLKELVFMVRGAPNKQPNIIVLWQREGS